MKDRDKKRRIGLPALALVTSCLTGTYFFDIKFMVLGLNIVAWDVLALTIWGLTRLWKWGGGGAGRGVVAAIVTAAGGFGAVVILFGMLMGGLLDFYIEEKEPVTGRVFVVEYREDFLKHGSARLYERFGPLLLRCDAEEYVGDISLGDEPSVYISRDGDEIVVAYFFLQPIFFVPIE